MRWIIQFFAAGAEQHVTPGDPAAVQHDHHLVVGPLLASRTCRGPRSTPARRRTRRAGMSPANDAYSSGWSSVCTARWLLLRVDRHALRHRPRHQHAVALQPEVPVQRAGVVLLDHERVVVALGQRTSAGTGSGVRVGALARYGASLSSGTPRVS